MSDAAPAAGGSARIARRLRVRGRVQGVGFRHAMTQAAARAGVHGWVRNRRDGSVEAHVEGEPADVATVIEWSRQGPRGAQVVAVEVEEASTDAALRDFAPRPSV